MGINVRIQNAPRQSGIIMAQVSLEEDLRSCMRCRYFYGSSSRCLSRKCVREEGRHDAKDADRESPCSGCPYRRSEGYCFPCMKKVLGRTEEEPA